MSVSRGTAAGSAGSRRLKESPAVARTWSSWSPKSPWRASWVPSPGREPSAPAATTRSPTSAWEARAITGPVAAWASVRPMSASRPRFWTAPKRTRPSPSCSSVRSRSPSRISTPLASPMEPQQDAEHEHLVVLVRVEALVRVLDVAGEARGHLPGRVQPLGEGRPVLGHLAREPEERLLSLVLAPADHQGQVLRHRLLAAANAPEEGEHGDDGEDDPGGDDHQRDPEVLVRTSVLGRVGDLDGGRGGRGRGLRLAVFAGLVHGAGSGLPVLGCVWGRARFEGDDPGRRTRRRSLGRGPGRIDGAGEGKVPLPHRAATGCRRRPP